MRELDKVIGYEGVKSDLYKIIDLLKNKEKYEALGVKMPHGILLDGSPGIGKTLMAECFIKESGRKAFTVRKDKPDGEFVNYIKQTFEEGANNSPSIVFLDDMDKFANEDDLHRDAEEYVTVQTCIDEVKNKDVFVIATTNEMRNLPGSLTRKGRFDWVIHLSFPRDDDARRIIDHFLSDKQVDPDVDSEEIMRFCRGYSCAALEGVINDAGLHAAYDGKTTITQKYIIDSCIRNFYHAAEPYEVSEEDMWRRAIHEAGHVTVAELLAPGSVDFVSINANALNGVGGMVARKKLESEAFKNREISVQIALAGKAATEIILGEIDTGNNMDMRTAFDFTRSIIDDLTAYGFDSWCHGKETSSKVYDNLDTGTCVEMSRYYLQVKKMIIDNRSFLEELAKRLFAEKTISYKVIAQVKDSINTIVSVEAS